MSTSEHGGRRWWVLAAAVGCLLAVAVDSGTAVLALPAVRQDLRLSSAGVVAVLGALPLALGALQVPATRVARRWGARRVLLPSLVVVVVGSMVAATAGSAWMLVAARLATGAGAAGVLPCALAVLVAAFPDEARSRALAIWAAFSGLLLVFAPLLAGLVLRHGWRPVLALPAGLAAVALVLTYLRVPDQPAPVTPAVARLRLAPLLVSGAVAGTLMLLSFALQDSQHRSALNNAVLLLPLAAGMLAAGARAGLRLRNRGAARVTTEGLLLSAIGLATHALPGTVALLVGLVLQGVGAALVVTATGSEGSRQLGTVLGLGAAGLALPTARTGDLHVAALTGAVLLVAVAGVSLRAGRAGAAPARAPSEPRPPASGR